MTTVETGKALVSDRKSASTATPGTTESGWNRYHTVYGLPSTPEDFRVLRSAHSQRRYGDIYMAMNLE